MKKYIQYNTAKFSSPTPDIGERAHGTPSDAHQNAPCSGMALDLSGKPGNSSSLAMVMGQKWTNEQESALDLSSHSTNKAKSGQSEALDLSKPSSSVSQTNNQAYPTPKTIHLSYGGNQAPSPSYSKAQGAVQYSLLQAALNSSQPNSSLHQSLLQASQLELVKDGRARGFPAGMGHLETGRTIKPFSSIATRPLDFGGHTMTMANTSVAVVQGIHKPMAITAPQPHNTTVSTKSQNISQTTVSFSQSTVSNGNQGYKMNQSRNNSPFHDHMLPGSSRGLKIKSGPFVKAPEGHLEPFVIRTEDGKSHVINRQNFLQMEQLSSFTCSQCPKYFKTKAALKLHTTVHKTSEERQYECQICKRRFLHRHHLVVHQRKHSGEKPFKCNACSKTFMAIFLLHKHLRKHVRENGRSSEISADQLQELHVKKVTSDGPDGMGIVGNVSKLIKPEQNPVIVLDEEETTNNNPQDVKKDNFSKSNFPEKFEVSGRALITDEKESVTEQPDNAKSTKKSECSQSPLDNSVIRKKTLPSEKVETLNSNTGSFFEIKSEAKQEVVEHKTVAAIEMTETEATVPGCNSDSVVAMGTPEKECQTFPVCGPGEEYELDFVTGELRVVTKREDSQIVSDQHLTNDNIVDNTDEKYDMKSESSERCSHTNNSDEKDISALEMYSNENSKETVQKNLNLKIEKDGNLDSKPETLQVTSNSSCSEKYDVLKDGKSLKRESLDNDGPDSWKKSKLASPDTDSNVENENSVDITRSKQNDNHSQLVIKNGGKSKKKGKRPKCDICSRTFSSNHHLVLHMSVHKRSPSLQSIMKANQMKSLGFAAKTNINCPVCKKVFKFQKSLNSHMRVHSEKLAQRKLLSKAFREFVTEGIPQPTSIQPVKDKAKAIQESQAKHEMNQETELDAVENTEEIAENDYCAVQRQSRNASEADIEPPIQCIIGEDNVKRYVCHACDNTYTTKQKLKMHALIHKDNCFLCDMCGKSFFREVTLDKHIATHLLPRPHICNVCKKSFIHRSSLMRHRVIHEAPTAPSLKQQVADINFEMKMLDTYTLLRQERLEKIKAGGKSENVLTDKKRLDALDLTVRIRADDPFPPPVLSPVNIPQIPPSSSNSFVNLSPPLITREGCDPRISEKSEVDKTVDVTEGSVRSNDIMEPLHQAQNRLEHLKERTTEEKSIKEKENPSKGHKKSRKTRVYQTSCRVCREIFPNVMSLKSHMTVHNTVETHLYECHICHHRFTQSCSLLRHLKTSCQENRMKCDPCGKTFHRRNTFEQHRRLHQVAPPNLDGSFYDKRRDEAEIKEERESDIENNNTKMKDIIKTEVIETETTNNEIDVVKAKEVLETNNMVYEHLRSLKEENVDYDSDARTYLYSEGEIRTRSLSDFSDTDFSPPPSPKKELPSPRTDLKSGSPKPMTLNLLSAVCSDIRNAEKENEIKRKELERLEERQKELETIEILANLRRGGFLQGKTAQRYKLPEISATGMQGKKSSSTQCSPVLQKDDPSHSEANLSLALSHGDIQLDGLPQKLNAKAIIPSTIIANDDKNKPSAQQIPTVVLEVAAQGAVSQAENNINVQSKDICIPIKPETTQSMELTSRLFSDLPKIKNPLVQERLSLLMKPQIPASSSKSSNAESLSKHSVESKGQGLSGKPLTTLAAFDTKPSVSSLLHTNHEPSKVVSQTIPQDLSVKKYVKSESNGAAHCIREKLQPPITSPLSPLVPVFHCELCGMHMYNENAFLFHKQQHDLTRKLLSRETASVASQKTTMEDTKPIDFTHGTGDRSAGTPGPNLHHSPPSTLDLSSKSIRNKSKLHLTKTGSMTSLELASPADLSDGFSSPGTPNVPNTASTDLIRQELRCKIYSRRRSQGLEDLTVEFKQPEPTEMTEEEKQKLNYRRECNRQAAQRSRMRKKDLVDSLLEELHKEEIVHSDLQRKMESLSAEKVSLIKALETHTCVKDKINKNDESAKPNNEKQM